MNELVQIKKRSFDEANARLKVFSEQSKKIIKLIWLILMEVF